MIGAIASLFSVLLLAGGLITMSWLLTLGLTPEARRPQIGRWLVSWSIRGLAVPMLLWAVLNVGLTWWLQPFMPQVQAARYRGVDWLPDYLDVLAAGVFLVSSYWTALTLAWVLTSAVRGAEQPARKEFKHLCLTWLIGLSIPAVILFLIGGLATLGLAATLLLTPIARYGRDILEGPKLRPMYSRAIARIKFGKYTDAEWEIIRQLEKQEDDFEGWMMLAELYAKHFKNLVEAEQTILELCDQPKTSASQLAVALHRLADWQLNIAQDPAAARRALLMICERLNGTHLAHMAQLRLNQLPVSRAELREQQTAQPIPLPALGDQFDEAPRASTLAPDLALKAANAFADQLRQNPNNVAVREKFARVLTEQLGKTALGIEQIELLLELPERSEAERAGWLGLIAAWHLKYEQDLDKGRKILERLTREFPNTAQAFAAHRRLEQLDRQLKVKPH